MISLAPATAYLVLLIAVLPVAAWVCWSDLSRMLIRNYAVYTLAAIWIVVGFLVVPFDAWAWRFANAGVVFAVGYLLFVLANFGGGDVKFATAAAPFFRVSDASWVLVMLAAFMLAALVAHRLMRAVPGVRAATPDWVSWSRTAHVPVGLSLAGTLVAYLAIMAFELLDEIANLQIRLYELVLPMLNNM